MKRILFLFVLVAVSVVSWVGAGEVIDRIAAIVNDEIILLSEIDEKVFLLQAQGQLQGRDSLEVDRVRRDILDRLIEEKLVVQRAKSQGISVDDTEIAESVDEALGRVRGQFPSEEEFQKALALEGITLLQLRERYEADVLQEKLAQRVVGREIRSKVSVTTEDVQRYYEENQAELPEKPDEVRLAHLVVEPIAMEKLVAAERSIVEAWEALGAGSDIETAGQKGGLISGELGRFCRGDLAPEIEVVLDTLQVGNFSVPTRSLQGFHVFQVTEREGDCYRLSHVLAPIPINEDDVRKARAKVDGARARALAGEQFETIVGEVSDDELTRDNGGDLGWAPTANLLPEVSAQLDSLGIGDVSTVVQSERGFHVFKLLERREGGEFTFDEIRDRLRQFVEAKRLEEEYDAWMNAVRDSAYVEVKAWARS